jgi:hypothetical protein
VVVSAGKGGVQNHLVAGGHPIAGSDTHLAVLRCRRTICDRYFAP